ncbi:MAG: CHAP domain-containing protein [Myxococcaceae bacterium]
MNVRRKPWGLPLGMFLCVAAGHLACAHIPLSDARLEGQPEARSARTLPTSPPDAMPAPALRTPAVPAAPDLPRNAERLTLPLTPERERIVAIAVEAVGRRRVPFRGVADDCVGFVEGVFKAAGVPLGRDGRRGDNATTAVFRFVRQNGSIFRDATPRPGDVAFFVDTYDRNRDGRKNDGLTHIAIVESVARDGTVEVIHRVRRGVRRARMNAQHPSDKLLNEPLRIAHARSEGALTGQLFAFYAEILPDNVRIALGGQ